MIVRAVLPKEMFYHLVIVVEFVWPYEMECKHSHDSDQTLLVIDNDKLNVRIELMYAHFLHWYFITLCILIAVIFLLNRYTSSEYSDIRRQLPLSIHVT